MGKLAAVLLCAAAGALAQYDPGLAPPVVHHDPGPEFGREWRTFDGIPGIERAPGGRLWATWYGGGGGEGVFNYVLLVTSEDDGASWSEPALTIERTDLAREFDPCLWLDPTGRLWLFWAQAMVKWDGRGGVWAITTDDPDAARPTWSEPRRLADGVMMNKPIATRAGDWLFPIAMWDKPLEMEERNERYSLGLTTEAIERISFDPPDRGLSYVYRSRDEGRTLERLGGAAVPDVDYNEHMVVERENGDLWMLVRTQYGIGQSVSADGGKTWSRGEPSGIPHPVTRFHLGRLDSSALLMVRHAPPDVKLKGADSRSHLTAFVSDDDGRTWDGGLLIDERTAVSYPDMTQAPDGRIHVIYDHDRQGDREILLVTFTEEAVRAGEGRIERSVVYRGSQ